MRQHVAGPSCTLVGSLRFICLIIRSHPFTSQQSPRFRSLESYGRGLISTRLGSVNTSPVT